MNILTFLASTISNWRVRIFKNFIQDQVDSKVIIFSFGQIDFLSSRASFRSISNGIINEKANFNVFGEKKNENVCKENKNRNEIQVEEINRPTDRSARSLIPDLRVDLNRHYGSLCKEEALWNWPVISVFTKEDIEVVLKRGSRYPLRPPQEIISQYRRSRQDRYTNLGLVNEWVFNMLNS